MGCKKGLRVLFLCLVIICQGGSIYAYKGVTVTQWEYTLDIQQEGTWKVFQENKLEKIEPYEWIWFRTTLPDYNPWGEKGKMFFPSYNKDFEIYLHGDLIYQSNDTFSQERKVFLERYHIVDLPKGFPGQEVYFKVNFGSGPVGFDMYNFAFTQVVLNSLSGFQYSLVTDHWILLITLSLAVFFGLIMLAASMVFLKKKEIVFGKVLLVVGASLLFFSLSLFSNQDLRFFIRDRASLWHYSSFLYFIIPSLFIYYMRHLVVKSELFPPFIPRLQGILIKGVLVFAAIVFLLDVFRIKTFYSFYGLTTGVYLLFMLFNLGLVIYGSRKGDVKCTILSRGLQMAIFMGIIQGVTILLGRPGTARVNRWSNLFFVAALFFTVIYEFFETFYQLEPWAKKETSEEGLG